MDNKPVFVKRTAKKNIIFSMYIYFLSILLSSCAVSNGLYLSIGENKHMDLWCIQILNDNEVLAGNAADDNNDVVKIITNGEHYSQWQRITGHFTCIDYWTYETNEGFISTVPVVVKSSEYENYKKSH